MAAMACAALCRRFNSFRVGASNVCIPMLMRLKGRVRSMDTYSSVRSSGLASRVISSACSVPYTSLIVRNICSNLRERAVREFLRQSRWSLSVLPSDNPCGFSVQCTRHGCTAASIRCEWWNKNRNRYSVSCKRYMNIDACHGMLMDICCKNSLLAGEYIGFRDI